MNDRFFSLQVFCRVARTGSFSAAGRDLGISQPTASRIVAALEKSVGATLLTRSTRTVAVTEAGADYLARAEAILSALDEADHAARGSGELRGVLRIACSTSTAVRMLLPRIARFTDLHPGLRVEFMLNDEKQDLIGDAIDVALRVGALADSAAVARKIATVHRLLAASPAYLAKAGTPRNPADLTRHTFILGPAGRGMEGWVFSKSGNSTSIRVEGRFVLNGNEGATAAAVAGLGIVSAGRLGMLKELQSGVLVRVLPEWNMGSADMHVVLPAGRAAKPSARAFSNFIVSELERDVDFNVNPTGEALQHPSAIKT
ncbi:LysR family transcriptional regulator [Paraburkholderia largidicola]|uniref:LysR family transcriptional regulator n=1 Tax=Paraburkholderia largidicola TaxID=3014751 RepID=A0A7I8C3Z2_9BURK|nr:LysR family transcriptional regulator [Paraburkholderia sp. PGU16]BCF95058.1 LysR family transcriptional regulator [Paraburkholderia sp. PGU16]